MSADRHSQLLRTLRIAMPQRSAKGRKPDEAKLPIYPDL
jgi:hypothetical protein